MKNWLTLVLMVACVGFTACDEESGENYKKAEDPKAFGTLCVHSIPTMPAPKAAARVPIRRKWKTNATEVSATNAIHAGDRR